MPDGMAGTERFMAFKSVNSGRSSTLNMAIGREASKVRARNVNLDVIFDDFSRGCVPVKFFVYVC